MSVGAKRNCCNRMLLCGKRVGNGNYWGGLGPARNPPSRTRDWPVMNEARSEHIHTTASAISIGIPKRPIGWRPRPNFFISGADILFRDAQDFPTAQGINYSLRSPYWLVGKNGISARPAHALAYISSLLLRTLPAIPADRDAGITDIPNPPEPDP